jgi:hypothetical protein
VGPGVTRIIQVKFTPTALGPAAAAMVITTTAALNPSITVNLTGNGTQSALSVVPASGAALAFGNVKLPPCIAVNPAVCGSTSLPVTFTNAATATANAVIGSTLFGGTNPARFATDLVPGTQLPPGTSTTVNVTFTPLIETSYAATLTFQTDDPVVTAPAYSLTGTGARPHFAIKPAPPGVAFPLAFPPTTVATTAAPLGVIITNTGLVSGYVFLPPALLMTSPPGAAAGFTFTPGATLTGVLAPGGTAAGSVTFSPGSVGDVYGGTFIFLTDQDFLSILLASATGSGI